MKKETTPTPHHSTAAIGNWKEMIGEIKRLLHKDVREDSERRANVLSAAEELKNWYLTVAGSEADSGSRELLRRQVQLTLTDIQFLAEERFCVAVPYSAFLLPKDPATSRMVVVLVTCAFGAKSDSLEKDLQEEDFTVEKIRYAHGNMLRCSFAGASDAFERRWSSFGAKCEGKGTGVKVCRNEAEESLCHLFALNAHAHCEMETIGMLSRSVSEMLKLSSIPKFSPGVGTVLEKHSVIRRWESGDITINSVRKLYEQDEYRENEMVVAARDELAEIEVRLKGIADRFDDPRRRIEQLPLVSRLCGQMALLGDAKTSRHWQEVLVSKFALGSEELANARQIAQFFLLNSQVRPLVQRFLSAEGKGGEYAALADQLKKCVHERTGNRKRSSLTEAEEMAAFLYALPAHFVCSNPQLTITSPTGI